MSHEAGGSKKFPLQPGVSGSAIFSVCEFYRTALVRHWAPVDGRMIVWVGMNPSTAAADIDDPTIRREIAFSKAWGYSRYVKLNVMDYRATYPEKLLEPGVVPCSGENLKTIAYWMTRCDESVMAWGQLHPKLQHYADKVAAMFVGNNMEPMCLGYTKAGHPRHPLYVKGTTPLEAFHLSVPA